MEVFLRNTETSFVRLDSRSLQGPGQVQETGREATKVLASSVLLHGTKVHRFFYLRNHEKVKKVNSVSLRPR